MGLINIITHSDETDDESDAIEIEVEDEEPAAEADGGRSLVRTLLLLAVVALALYAIYRLKSGGEDYTDIELDTGDDSAEAAETA